MAQRPAHPESTPQPLSLTQERLWLLTRLAPENPVFHRAEAVRLHGPLDAAALARSLTAVVRRHDVLRSTFVSRDGQPIAAIAPADHPDPPLADLARLDPGERDRELRRLAVAAARGPFDLGRGPLLRAVLLRLDAVEHVLVLTAHHLVADAWSLHAVLQELTVLYPGGAAAPPERPTPYADFARRQRQWLQGAAAARQLAWWKRRLAGAPGALDLPADRPRPAVASYRGARSSRVLPPPLTADLRGMSETAGASLRAVLLAAFAALLQRYAGRDDLVLGLAHRHPAAGTVGPFANPLVLRADLRGNPAGRRLVAGISALIEAAWKHRDLPFERLIEALRPARDLSRAALVQVLFAFRSGPPPLPELRGLRASRLEIDPGTAPSDLGLEIEDVGSTLTATVEYATDLFDPTTMARLHGHLRNLLAALAADPRRRLAELPLLSPGERHQLLRDWNDARAPLPEATDSPELFAAQAARPEAGVVVVDRRLAAVPVGVPGQLVITGLARGDLGRPGLTAERFVPDPLSGAPGWRLYRTGDRVRYRPDGTLELLGRIDRQVEVQGLRIDLGEIEAVLATHPAIRECAVVVREDEDEESHLVAYVVRQGDATPAASADDEFRDEQLEAWKTVFDFVYRREPTEPDPTFNTIGWIDSYTGQPIPADLMREWLDDTVERILALGPRRVLEIGCGTGMLLFRIAPHCDEYLATDFSSEVRGYLGQRLARLDRPLPQVRVEQRRADSFAGLRADSFDLVILNSVIQYFPGVDYLVAVLRRAAEVVRPGGAIFVGDVRCLPFNEAHHATVQLAWAAAGLPCADLAQRVRVQQYREKELLLDPAFFPALAERVPKLGRVAIYLKEGRTSTELNTFRYQAVLHVEPDPPPPEEIVWHDWRREGLSLERVRELLAAEGPETLALANVPNARLSGPLAVVRLLHDPEGPATAGELRRRIAAEAEPGIDPQDFRTLAAGLPYEVEPGWSQPGEEGAFEVVFRRRSQGPATGPRPIPAPAVPGPPAPWSHYANQPLSGRRDLELVPQLRRFLARKLPESMVPATFVFLAALPRTRDHKVDRALLGRLGRYGEPGIGLVRADPRERYLGPRNPVEEELAAIWAEVLGVGWVGMGDDFFALGGQSLLATRVVARVRSAMGVEVPLWVLFATPTVAGLAAYVSAQDRE